MHTILNDQELFEKIKKSDIRAFEIVFKKYYKILCNFSCKYLHDMDKAEETVQDLFFTLWDKREGLIIKSSVKSYLYRSVYNNSINYLKHRTIENKYENYMRDTVQPVSFDPAEYIKADEINEIIDFTLNSLPERSRTIFTLNRFDGLKYHEIAEKLSLSVKTIEANMTRVLKLLRKNLKEYLETT